MTGYIILDRNKHKYISIHKTWWLAYCAIEDICKNKYISKKRFEILKCY